MPENRRLGFWVRFAGNVNGPSAISQNQNGQIRRAETMPSDFDIEMQPAGLRIETSEIQIPETPSRQHPPPISPDPVFRFQLYFQDIFGGGAPAFIF